MPVSKNMKKIAERIQSITPATVYMAVIDE